MSTLVPNALLFRFAIPLRHRAAPVVDGDLDDWSDDFLLPAFGALDGHPAFGRIWMAWNEHGLYVACRVEGRRMPFQCDPAQFWKGDNLRICTDTRDTRDLRRASRYCQQFYLLPSGGGPRGREAVGGSARIHRAAENAPVAPAGSIPVASRRDGHAYTIEAHLPATMLSGWDPEEHPRIGLFVMLEDVELGRQPLTVGDDLNWHIDPSTWPTAVLTRDG